MEINKTRSATLVVTDARPFADGPSMAYPSTKQAFDAVQTIVAAGFGATAGVALLPTRNATRHIDPSRLGTRPWSPPV